MHLYGQYCPVARAAEIFADRWTVLILRELLAEVAQFNELGRGLPGASRSLLSERLDRLVRAGVLVRREAGRGRPVEYRLTAGGRALQPLIDAMGAWGARWAFGEPRPTELDPIVLLWWMRRRVRHDQLPRARMVIRFEFRGTPRPRYWLVLRPGEASVCLKDPGFDVDLAVAADIASFYRVWLGHTALAGALRNGEVRLDGAPADVRGFPRWFAWSPMAEAVRAARKRQLLDARPSVDEV
ncbi:MAG TPA: helix-turn-helix domain-containing protein [Gemmatimonadales bacterium]|nr:helix-turn-helix domain-containing protein [Gemmatimonadales bacterium]